MEQNRIGSRLQSESSSTVLIVGLLTLSVDATRWDLVGSQGAFARGLGC